MSILRNILIPICFSLMLGILLNPLMIKLESFKIPKLLAISISLLVGFTIIVGVAYFLISQILNFGEDLPVLQTKFIALFGQLQQMIESEIGFNIKHQNQWLTELETGMKPLIGQTLGNMAGTIGVLFLLPVYTFLLLYYKKLVLHFLYEIFIDTDSVKVSEILKEIKGAIQRYMVGLLLEAIIVALLNTVALLLFGLKYAVLLGIMAAILNLLPYIGGFIAIFLPVLVATITKDGINTQVGIIAAYLFIQFLDNQVIFPLIVSSRVRINTLISIVVILLGGALWGISGMFLSIPFVGVLKLIFDRIDELKPWGKLLGTEVATIRKLRIRKKL
jgi:predicted PurR-regulated permease PerM